MSVNEKMTALADAIREKTGRTDTLTLDEMVTAIQEIEDGPGAGGIETCTVSLVCIGKIVTLYYTDENMATNSIITAGTGFTQESFLVPKNTILSYYSTSTTGRITPQNGCSLLFGDATMGAIEVSGDGSIAITNS